jgi:hypothetical protein
MPGLGRAKQTPAAAWGRLSGFIFAQRFPHERRLADGECGRVAVWETLATSLRVIEPSVGPVPYRPHILWCVEIANT